MNKLFLVMAVRWIAALLLIAVEMMVNVSAVEPGSRLSADEVREVVALHNRIRKEVGVGPVVWSPKLAEFAQAWADEIARTGKFEHRPREGEWANDKYGENIAIGFGPGFGVTTGMRQWAGEREAYVPGTAIPDDDATPEAVAAFKAGHYTQMVWRTTMKIGAGRAIIATGEMKGRLVVVCNYDPPGNARGEKPY